MSSSSSSLPSGLVRVNSFVRANSMYRAMLGQMQKQTSTEGNCDSNSSPRRPRILSLESLMSLGLGSAANGETINDISCANESSRTSTQKGCFKKGCITCARCRLVKYCSERCQRQHWRKHSISCTHSYMDTSWQPLWVTQSRAPHFLAFSIRSPSVVPAFDVLRLEVGEETKNYKLCFVACKDIRNLVKTVNNLPKNYQGKCELLLNNVDPISINQSLVVLYALLNSELPVEEAAEFATHLMYSAALTAPGDMYLQRCVDRIYGNHTEPGDISFRTSLGTRGVGRIRSLQTAVSVKEPLDMFRSKFNFPAALKSLGRISSASEDLDDWERSLYKLRPSHRMAFRRFRETGVVAPFSLNTSAFTHPNRLLFSAQGAPLYDSKSLRGWDSTAIQTTGAKHGVDPADIFGCLFFHVKSELREFARRVRDFNITIYLTQFHPQILSKGLLAGVLPAFEGACFDRIDTSDLVDDIGVRACLADWGPLLKAGNPYSTLITYSRAWHEGRQSATARCNPQAALVMLLQKCGKNPKLKSRLKSLLAQGPKSPALLRLIESLDAFFDHDAEFRQFLCDEGTDCAAAALGLERRDRHQIHPKRFGVPLNVPDHQLPCMSRSEFYDLAMLSEVDFSARFLEFQVLERS